MPSTDGIANLRPFTSETAREAARKRLEKARAPVDVDPSVPNTSRNRIGKSAWTRNYTERVFPSVWAGYYRTIRRGLLAQYVEDEDKEQYRILVDRTAALATHIAMLEAKGADRDLCLRHDNVLRTYIGQLQRYTEAEKREISLQSEIMVSTLTRVVGIAESVITDTTLRAAFMRALSVALGDQTAADSPLTLAVGDFQELDPTDA